MIPARGTTLRLAIVFLCTAGSLLILQQAFDSSDHGKAERAVRNYRVDGTNTQPLGTFLEQRFPGGAWTTEITHGCRGVVRVAYSPPSGSPIQYDYDVPGHRIHPGNEAGRAALESFATKK